MIDTVNKTGSEPPTLRCAPTPAAGLFGRKTHSPEGLPKALAHFRGLADKPRSK